MSETKQEGDFKIKSKPKMKKFNKQAGETIKVDLSKPAEEPTKVVIPSEEPAEVVVKEEKLMVLKDTIKNQINQVSEKSIEGMPSLQKQILNFEPSEQVQSLLSKDTNNSESLLERK